MYRYKFTVGVRTRAARRALCLRARGKRRYNLSVDYNICIVDDSPIYSRTEEGQGAKKKRTLFPRRENGRAAVVYRPRNNMEAANFHNTFIISKYICILLYILCAWCTHTHRGV